MGFITFSVIVLWILVAVLTFLVLLVYRQFGLLYLGSSGAVRLRGREVGQHAPDGLLLRGGDGGEIPLDWRAAGDGRFTVLLLTAEKCPLCNELLLHLDDFIDRWKRLADVIVADRVEREVDNVRGVGTRRWRHGLSVGGACHAAFDVDVQPYTYIIDSAGIIRARDIVNVPQAIDAMLRHVADDGRNGSAVETQTGEGQRTHASS